MTYEEVRELVTPETPLSTIEFLCTAIQTSSIDEPENITLLANAIKVLAEAAVLIAPLQDDSISG